MPRIGRKVTARARSLRGDPTEAEKILWHILRAPPFDGWRFRRQHPVPPYFLDFACVKRALAIELDGGQHCGSAHDRHRDTVLASKGWQILRFWNNEVFANPEGVARTILAALGPHPNPPPAAPGEGA